ncbi:hypothetical protein ACFWC9_39965 [Streptomyces goshikiensis]
MSTVMVASDSPDQPLRAVSSWSVMVTGSVALLVGIFLGMAISKEN